MQGSPLVVLAFPMMLETPPTFRYCKCLSTCVREMFQPDSHLKARIFESRPESMVNNQVMTFFKKKSFGNENWTKETWPLHHHFCHYEWNFYIWLWTVALLINFVIYHDSSVRVLILSCQQLLARTAEISSQNLCPLVNVSSRCTVDDRWSSDCGSVGVHANMYFADKGNVWSLFRVLLQVQKYRTAVSLVPLWGLLQIIFMSRFLIPETIEIGQ